MNRIVTMTMMCEHGMESGCAACAFGDRTPEPIPFDAVPAATYFEAEKEDRDRLKAALIAMMPTGECEGVASVGKISLAELLIEADCLRRRLARAEAELGKRKEP